MLWNYGKKPAQTNLCGATFRMKTNILREVSSSQQPKPLHSFESRVEDFNKMERRVREWNKTQNTQTQLRDDRYSHQFSIRSNIFHGFRGIYIYRCFSCSLIEWVESDWDGMMRTKLKNFQDRILFFMFFSFCDKDKWNGRMKREKKRKESNDCKKVGNFSRWKR